MKYQPEMYARAFLELLNEGQMGREEALKNFLHVIEKNGDTRHAKKIVRETEKRFLKNAGHHRILIESARPLRDSQFAELKKQFDVHDHVENSINQNLLAGMRILIDDEQVIDVSLKGRLQKLFMS